MSDERLPARALHCYIQGERNDEQYQWDGALIINIKEDIKDLGPMQAVDMTRDRINRWLTKEKKRREEEVD